MTLHGNTETQFVSANAIKSQKYGVTKVLAGEGESGRYLILTI